MIYRVCRSRTMARIFDAWICLTSMTTVAFPHSATFIVESADSHIDDAVMDELARVYSVWNLMMETCGFQRHNMELVPKIHKSTFQCPPPVTM